MPLELRVRDADGRVIEVLRQNLGK
jgi:hypothetical protein